MRKTDSTLNTFLKSKGIQPHIFSFFICSFIKKESKKKPSNALKFHLGQVLVAQSELIKYHLLRH